MKTAALLCFWLIYGGITCFRVVRYGNEPMGKLPQSFRITTIVLLLGTLIAVGVVFNRHH